MQAVTPQACTALLQLALGTVTDKQDAVLGHVIFAACKQLGADESGDKVLSN